MKEAVYKIKQQARSTLGGKKIWLHIGMFLLMLLYMSQALLQPGVLKKMGAPYDFFVGAIGITLFFYLGICYTLLLVLLPLLYTRRNKLFFWLAFIVNILFWVLVKTVIYKFWAGQFPDMGTEAKLSIKALFFRGGNDLYFFILFLSLYYFIDIYSHQREIRLLEQLKTEKLTLETGLLKSQVNPHFLFNTLNNIYSLSMSRSPETRNIIARLRSLLHYMLYDCRAELVPLAQEIAFMNSYISLEKIRHKEEQCEVSVNVSGEMENKQIVPLLLINFLENAFKHGVKSGTGKAWIGMKIEVQPKSLQFDLHNSKPARVDTELAINEYTGGIGIQNVRRRLELLYPDRHTLNISEDNNSFHVSLQIKF